MKISKLELIEQVKTAKDALLENENESAKNILENLLREDPGNEQLWLLFGVVERRLKKFNKAIKCFQTATELDPSLVEGWGLLTITYLDINKDNKAKQVIDKALKLNPSNKKIQFYQENLIYVYNKFGFFIENFI